MEIFLKKMSVAVLLIGHLRALEKTFKSHIQNLIEPNNADVFCYIDHEDTSQSHRLKELFPQIKKVLVCPPPEQLQVYYREIQSRPAIHPESWDYLQKSRDLLELYQLHKCYKMMEDYEEERGFPYTYVVKSLFHSVLLKPLNISSWYTLDEKRYENSLINSPINSPSDRWENLVEYLFPLKERSYTYNHTNNIYNPEDAKSLIWTTCPSFSLQGEGKEYYEKILQEIKVLRVFRKNIIIIGKREEFDLIKDLIFFYGSYHAETYCGFNMENQLVGHCNNRGIYLLSFHNSVEESYLTQPNLNRTIFDNEGNLNPSLPDDLRWSLIL